MKYTIPFFIFLSFLTSCSPIVSVEKQAAIPSATIISIPYPTSFPVRTAVPSLPVVSGLPPETIKSYLAANVGSTGFGGKVFCAYEILDVVEDESSPALYLWALCQEYFGEKSLSRGTGVSLPVALYLQKGEDTFVISSYKIPGDGTKYAADIKTLFPVNTWESIFGKNITYYNHRAQSLQYETEGDAMAYYGVINLPSTHPTYTPLP